MVMCHEKTMVLVAMTICASYATNFSSQQRKFAIVWMFAGGTRFMILIGDLLIAIKWN